MGTNETITHSKLEKSSSTVQLYYCPGVPIPAPYFSAAVPPAHTHPYMWSPQLMLTPFGSPYTAAIYPHGVVYSHPSVTHISSPVKIEVPVMPSTVKGRGIEEKIKVLDNLAVSISSNAKAAGLSLNRSSESDENGAEGSSDGSNVNSESGGSERRNSCPEVLPSSGGKDADKLTNSIVRAAPGAPPTISLGMSADLDVCTRKPCTVFRANLTREMDLGSSCVGKLEPGEEHIPPRRDRVEENLKREKRKQSNRESAKRSRLRKQAETEELAIKYGTLTAENASLRSEITWLTQSSDKLRLENSSLMKKMRMAEIGEEDAIVSVNYDDAPSIVIENLLSRIDDCNEMEDEPHENSGGELHQLIDSNPPTDSVAAS